MITDLPHKVLGGGVFAMRRFNDYEGIVFWREHVLYKGFRIMGHTTPTIRRRVPSIASVSMRILSSSARTSPVSRKKQATTRR